MNGKTRSTRTRVGKYELGRTLGEGSFGKVKFAKNVETGDFVAIKILDRDQVLRHKMVEQVGLGNGHGAPSFSSPSAFYLFIFLSFIGERKLNYYGCYRQLLRSKKKYIKMNIQLSHSRVNNVLYNVTYLK